MIEFRTRRIGAALRHRWALGVAAGVTVVLVGAGASAAMAASSTPSPSASASTSAACTPRISALLHTGSAALKADLKTLKKDSKAKKPAERAAIKKKALAGGYGAEIARVSQIVDGHSTKITAAAIPAALKADLKTLRAEPAKSAARKAEVQTIFTKATAGTYGATIEAAAKAATTKATARCTAKAKG